jgi:hypothetical protein
MDDESNQEQTEKDALSIISGLPGADWSTSVGDPIVTGAQGSRNGEQIGRTAFAGLNKIINTGYIDIVHGPVERWSIAPFPAGASNLFYLCPNCGGDPILAFELCPNCGKRSWTRRPTKEMVAMHFGAPLEVVIFAEEQYQKDEWTLARAYEHILGA